MMKLNWIPGLAFLLCCTLSLSAQTEKGTKLLGGGIAYTAFDGGHAFFASPNVGIFLLDNAALTASFDLISNKVNTSWAVGPGIKLYLGGMPRGRIITKVGINLGGSTGTKTGVGFDVGGGYAFFLNEDIGIELIAQYQKTGSSKGVFFIGAGFQIYYKN